MMLSATYDTGKGRRELGFEPAMSLEAGMAKVHEWLAASARGEAPLPHGGLVGPKS